MPTQDPKIQSLVGRIGRYSRAAGAPPKKPVPDAVIPVEQRAGYHAEVDPDGALPLRVRQQRAAAAYKRDIAMAELRAYRSGGPDDGDAA